MSGCSFNSGGSCVLALPTPCGACDSESQTIIDMPTRTVTITKEGQDPVTHKLTCEKESTS